MVSGLGVSESLCALLGSPQRCRILRELAKSEWLPVTYLGAKAGISRTAASQHIATLLRLKVVERGVGRLYRLVPALRPAPAMGGWTNGFPRLPCIAVEFVGRRMKAHPCITHHAYCSPPACSPPPLPPARFPVVPPPRPQPKPPAQP